MKQKDGPLARLGVAATIVLVCALLGGGFFALHYLFPSRRDRAYDRRRRTEQMMQDTAGSMKFRFFAGSLAGAVAGVAVAVFVDKEANR